MTSAIGASTRSLSPRALMFCGVAGSLNIVLRDGYSIDGRDIRGGGLLFDDGKVKPTGGVYYGRQLGPGRILIGTNVEGRYNPEKKFSLYRLDARTARLDALRAAMRANRK